MQVFYWDLSRRLLATGDRLLAVFRPRFRPRSVAWAVFAHGRPRRDTARDDRPTVYGTEGREFESLRARWKGPAEAGFSPAKGNFWSHIWLLRLVAESRQKRLGTARFVPISSPHGDHPASECP